MFFVAHIADNNAMKKFALGLILPLVGLGVGFMPDTDVVCEMNCEYAEIAVVEDVADKKEFIRWIDFNATSETMKRCITASKKLDGVDVFDMLAYVALRNGNEFNNKRDAKVILGATAEKIDAARENKYFRRYREGFEAVLGGVIDCESSELTGYHPIAKGYWFSGYDDFGVSRTYGYKRRHLGHDLYGGVGTPIIAMEGGTVTELGWNRYGGWRVGIRSEDTKRYYYYAHLRKDKPFPDDLNIGDRVEAGHVIGFLGNTGYSRTPNVNMKTGKPHLHFGLQIIFDESQEDGSGEIWVDVYQICRLLSGRRVKVQKT